jgi:hypothetical protein
VLNQEIRHNFWITGFSCFFFFLFFLFLYIFLLNSYIILNKKKKEKKTSKKKRKKKIKNRFFTRPGLGKLAEAGPGKKRKIFTASDNLAIQEKCWVSTMSYNKTLGVSRKQLYNKGNITTTHGNIKLLKTSNEKNHTVYAYYWIDFLLLLCHSDPLYLKKLLYEDLEPELNPYRLSV